MRHSAANARHRPVASRTDQVNGRQTNHRTDERSAVSSSPAISDSPIGVAVIGAGYWGPNLVRNFQGSPAFRLRWLCDLDRDRARRVLGDYSTVQVTDDLDTVLADETVQAVAIATPAGTHLPVALAALRAGRHVLVEKPLAATYDEGRQLVEEADRRGLTLMCDHTYCYTPAVLRIRELLRSGDLGELHYLDSVRINLGLVQRDIDVVWDLAPHDLSILDFVLPPGIAPTAVAAHGADGIGAGRSCVAYLTLQLNTGAIAHIHVNWLSPVKIRTAIIGGSKRTLIWDDLNPSQRLAIFDRGVDVATPEELGDEERRDVLVSYRSGDMVAPALTEREALRTMVEEYARAIRTGSPALTDGRSGLRVLQILQAASHSLANGGLMVDLQGGSEG
ncbi:gfo/Idh/MocA family oxidoreductase [Micromonospora terminaliae]|uniref:Gfo/Idh/MocA family oxidoreductase n=1 Tax=Micromonospora terminaliae TaxID=1914461 RepID=A0AAJ2ZK52_9ACTN|nr:Gfo/Idh/MocA family oxidoreductase [Micromonospora terminaliae]NES30533.1 Gfo/Idh/MocA family oxidoreductase [Micromonospora terminaliae]QGL51234.1 gfo/Idh/MocA family oxidoreductase [Micromonospora terminaliae]